MNINWRKNNNSSQDNQLYRKAETSQEHDDLTKKVIAKLMKNGYTNIKADHIGHDSAPEPTRSGHIIDVTAEKNGEIIGVDVKVNTNNLDSEQLKDFRKTYDNFCLAVPKSCADEIMKKVEDFGVKPNEWFKF